MGSAAKGKLSPFGQAESTSPPRKYSGARVRIRCVKIYYLGYILLARSPNLRKGHAGKRFGSTDEKVDRTKAHLRTSANLIS